MKHATILGLLALAASGAAQAGPYLGGGALLSDYQYSDVDRGAGGRAFLGYRFENLPLMVEAGYTDFGEADIESFPGLSLGFTGGQVTVGYFLGLSQTSNSGLWLKGGFYAGDSEIKDATDSFEKYSRGGLVSIGGDWMVLPWLGLRAEVENFFNVRDYADFEVNHRDDVTVASLNLVFEWPMARHEAPAQEATPAPVYTPPAYTAQPAPVATPAPAVTPTPQRQRPPAASVMTLKATTPLRDQPRPDAAVSAQLSAGSSVTLRTPLDNAYGGWWFVHSDAGIGWVEAGALQ